MFWPKPIPRSLVDRVTVIDGAPPDGATLPYVSVQRDGGEVNIVTAVWNESGVAHPCRDVADERAHYRNQGLDPLSYPSMDSREFDEMVGEVVRAEQVGVAALTIVHELMGLDWPIEIGEDGSAQCDLLPGFHVSTLGLPEPVSLARIRSELASVLEPYVAAGQWRELAEVRYGLRTPFAYDESITVPPEHECDTCEACGDCHGCSPLSGRISWDESEEMPPVTGGMSREEAVVEVPARLASASNDALAAARALDVFQGRQPKPGDEKYEEYWERWVAAEAAKECAERLEAQWKVLRTTDTTRPATMRTVAADMAPDSAGPWLFHCHVSFDNDEGKAVLYRTLP